MYQQSSYTVLVLALLCAPSQANVSNLTLSVPEGLPAHTVVGDLATGLSRPTLGFFISESRDSHVFRDLEIDPDTGIISTATVLDRETRGSYDFVAATLAGEVVGVRINVEDINDNSPAFPSEDVDLRVSELSPPGSRFQLEGARDQDEGEFGTQGYRIREGHMGELFRLEQHSARNHLSLDLFLAQRLDREAQDFYTLTVEAFDGGIPARIGILRVNIWVLDENDNPPVFNRTEYQASVAENAPVGSSVCRVHATDRDQGDNARVSYEINRRQSNPDDFFSVDETTGMVFLNKPLDFEAQAFHELIVTARDNGVQPESSSTLVVVKVLNVNDNSPAISVLFLSESGDALVSEAAEIGDYVARISVSDPDGQKEIVSVRLEGGDGKFTLQQTEDFLYALCVCAQLDREEKDLYKLRVLASDLGSPPLGSEAVLLVKVSDANDWAPVFNKDMFVIRVSEDAPEGTSVVRLEAQDSDQGVNADITYSVLKSNWDCPVSVDAESGLVITTGDLDRERQPEVCLFLVVAEDRGEPARSTTATVTLVLDDVNDNEPVFQQKLYNANVTEHSSPGTCFLQVVANDADGPEFSVLVYSLPDNFEESDQDQNLFYINSQTGELCVSKDIDRDAGQTVHDILVRAEDPGGLSAHTYVHIEIQDLNDNAPVFNPERYATSIGGHAPPGTEILGAVATDADAGRFGRVTYHILPGDLSALFALDKQTGLLYLTSSLTHLGAASIRLAIAAQDGGGVSSARPAQVTVHVLASTHAPAVFHTARYAFTVPEDAPPGTSVGIVRATNPSDSAESVSYRISSGDPRGLFAVDTKSGLISTVHPLDHESLPYALLFLQAYAQSSPVYGGTWVNITVADVNDAAPVFHRDQDAVFVSENARSGTTVYIAHAHDDDSDANARVTYHLRGSRYSGVFTVDPNLGTVTLNQSLTAEPQESPILLEITAEDGGDPPRSATLALTVNVDKASLGDGLAFETLVYRVEIDEAYHRDSRMIQVSAHRIHEASSKTAALVYSLEGEAGFPPVPFRIHPRTGWLYLSDNLDYERESAYRFRAVATAGEANATAAVVVLVLDVNDNSPVFSRATYYLVLPEGPSPRGQVGQVTATDRDSGKNAQLSYILLSDGKFFRINSETGEIVNWVELDREQQSQHTLEVMVADRGNPRRNATASVHILVTDVNDNAPQFRHLPASKERNLQISSGLPTGSFVTNVFAKDLDVGENGTVTFTLLTVGAEGQRLRHFEIDGKSADIRTTSLFKRSVETIYILKVTARDGGSPPLENTALVHVQVYGSEAQSGQASPPVARCLWVREDASLGTVIGSVRIVSTGKKVGYSITEDDKDSHFGVNSQSGDIYIHRSLDYEEAAQYSLTAFAEDNAGGNITMRVFVTVEDVNDHPPWFPDKMVVFALREDAALGSLAFAFGARDGDGTYPNSALRYSLTSPPGFPFHMNPRTGRLTVAASPDREASPAYTFTVTASDQAEKRVERRHVSVTARVFLLDVNDNPPAFESADVARVAEDAAEGSLVHHFLAADADEQENGTVSYVILAGNQKGLFTLDEKSGLLWLSAPLDFETARFHRLSVGAVDAGLPPLSSSQTLTVEVVDVNDRPPVFSQDVYTARVAENREPGELVVQVSAADEDSEENAVVWYCLLPGPGFELFSINPYTGLITTSAFLDREQQPQFTLRVQARDSGPRPLSSITTVLCSVLDDNDNPPGFSQSSIQISLLENLPPGVLHTAQASDPDVGENGTVRYSILGEDHGVFAIDRYSGAIKTLQILNREDHQIYILTIQAHDGGPAQLSSTTQLQLLLLDQNDNAPAFTRDSYHASISEDLPAGAVVLSVTALDPDHGTNGDVMYSLMDDGSRGAFSVDPSTGAILTTRNLDRETRAQFSLKVLATDCGNEGPLSSVASVIVLVDDVNDNAPVCENSPVNAIVSTETLPNRVVATVKARDADRGPNGTIRFFLPENDENLFDINEETGEISMRRRVRSGFSGRKLWVAVSDQGNPAQTSSCLVFVHLKGEIEDLHFTNKVYNSTIVENSKAGTWIATVDARQQLDGQSERISYAIFSRDIFSIDSHTGEIRVQKDNALDFETSPRVELTVLAENGRQTAHCRVDVTLRDDNDNAPVFERDAYRTAVWEGQVSNTYIKQVFAYDADSGTNGQIEFSIISGNHNGAFILDSVRGILATNAMLDREITSSYKLVVQASDKGNPPLSSTAIIWLQVVDVNDNSPAIPPMESVLISENLPAGYVVTQLTANDVDLSQAITYSFAGNAAVEGAFAVDRYTGAVTLTRALDFEEEAELTLTIWASDSLHQTSGDLKVQVLDVNDHSPVFNQVSYQVELSELAQADTFVMNVSATDKDSGLNGKITYRLLSSLLQGFYVQAHSGSIYTNKPIKATADSNPIRLLIEAQDGGDPVLSTVTSVDVLILDTNDHTPLFSQDIYTVTVSEDAPFATTLLTLFASDQDWSSENTHLDYALVAGNEERRFCLEVKSTQVENRMKNVGQLVICGPLDRETVESYALTVSVSDRGMPRLNSSVVVTVTVLDCNDNAPFFASTEYHVQVSENSHVGTSLAQVNASDPDLGGNGLLHYDIISGNSGGHLKLDPESGVLVVNTSLDYEEDSEYTLTIRVSDSSESPGDRKVAFTMVFIMVLDENDNSPYFLFPTFNCSVLENLPAFTHVCSIRGVDKDMGVYGQLTYSVLSSCFADFDGVERKESPLAVDPRTGDIRTRQTLDYEHESKYCLVVEAQDKGAKAATVRVHIFVKGVDEFSPIFTKKQYHFLLPGDAKPGDTVGFVMALDQDVGVDGIVEYSLLDPPPFFSINKTVGAIYASRPMFRRRSNEGVLELSVSARSPRQGSRRTSCQVFVNVSSSAEEHIRLPLNGHMLSLSISFAIVLLFLIVFVGLVLRFKVKEAALKKMETNLKQPDSAFSLQGMKPGILMKNCGMKPRILMKNCDASNCHTPPTWSGRGSAEGETAEDQEIKWINEYPCHEQAENRTLENPDGDAASCRSVDVGLGQFLSVGMCLVSEMASAESLHHFKEEGGGKSLLVRIRERDLDGKSADSLSFLERLDGGYTWDYLLDWEPCFQTLASVFTDIGMLPDQELQGGREDPPHPPPLITSVARPGLQTVPPCKPSRAPSLRRRPSYPRYAYSPLTRNTGLTPTAMTPTFSQSLSSLTISPVVTDAGVGGIRLDSGPLTASLLEAEIQV
ncbi:protocadherin-23 isoform X1 [Phyllopteryx taeniolatus]|uniref:protocadherin-23 isoform X1 n=1 Tax=Phyllopteryx taeniolatus TaxID=161469 RepID=UPI002AD4737E|nr:protocadherin-23 isoform X1 [Phyllopteryx taeniolatus]XP_061626479.1 protocadherin-23 isoform X1 [Phyllopteryx taeniolatus]